MAKKRKGSGQPYGSGKPVSDGESSKIKLDTWEDVADSEDEFHLNRDKILLDEGPDAKRRRKIQEEDAFLEQSDEEVLGYEESSDDDEVADYDEEYEEEADEDDEKPKSTRRKAKSSTAAEEEEDEDLGGWGPSKSDYYNADAIETEQDALDEEAEALRIQKSQLKRMSAADFGLNDDSDSDEEDKGSDQEEDEEQIVTEVLPQPKLTQDVGPDERLKILHERYPEFEHLRKDLLELHPRASELRLLAEATLRTRSTTQLAQRQPVAVIKWRAITAYLGAISMYFALLTSTYGKGAEETITAMQPQQLHNHPVMESLLRCRDIWNQVKDLPIDDVDSTELSVIEEELDLTDAPLVDDSSAGQLGELKSKGAPRKQANKVKSKAQRRAEKAQEEVEALQAEKTRKLEEELALLSGLTSQDARKNAAKSRSSKAHLATFDDDSDLGEETRLTEEALDEKAKRKRSLKFYTSQIAQKANKRSAAGKDYGGDIDVPRKERFRDRQARLNAEAEKRGRKTQGADEELGGDSDEEDRRQALEIRGDNGNDSDDFYDQVVSRNKKRKLDKQEAADAYARAAAEGGQVIETEDIGPDGKRQISYQILKNKGLTPHRKKDVRNPRVKKKKKYEAAKKKLKSIRAVYSGGEGKGGYAGELTGIKKGLVKSVKL